MAAQVDQRVLKDFLGEKLPRLAAHLEQHGVDVTLVTFHWFLVLFVENLPGDVLLPLWDAFLYEGSKVGWDLCGVVFRLRWAWLIGVGGGVPRWSFGTPWRCSSTRRRSCCGWWTPRTSTTSCASSPGR